MQVLEDMNCFHARYRREVAEVKIKRSTIKPDICAMRSAMPRRMMK